MKTRKGRKPARSAKGGVSAACFFIESWQLARSVEALAALGIPFAKGKPFASMSRSRTTTMIVVPEKFRRKAAAVLGMPSAKS